MPKYNCTITFDLETRVEFDGSLDIADSIDGHEETNDETAGYDSADVSVGGGEITCVVVADDEDAAIEACEALDGREVEDSNGFTWVVASVNVEVEAEEMGEDEAKQVVRDLLARLTRDGQVTDHESEAIKVVLSL